MAQEYIAGAAPTTPLGREEVGEDLDRAA
jgi:hypothetical protein